MSNTTSTEQGAQDKAEEIASDMFQWITDCIIESGNTVSKPLVRTLAEHICARLHCEAGKFTGGMVKERKDYWYRVIKAIRYI